MRLIVKIENIKNVIRDLKSLLKSDDFPKLKAVNAIKGEATELLIDLSYSTILGYSKDSLRDTLDVLTANLVDERINSLFDTNYTPEELSRAILKIDTKTMKVHQKEVCEPGADEPSFIDIAVLFKAQLVLN